MEQPFAPQSFQLAPRRSMGTQGGSLVGDHAWETSFGESDRNDRQNTSHFSNPSSPKTIALFLKRSTKPGRTPPTTIHPRGHASRVCSQTSRITERSLRLAEKLLYEQRRNLSWLPTSEGRWTGH